MGRCLHLLFPQQMECWLHFLLFWPGGGGGDAGLLITHLQTNSGSGLLGSLQAFGMGWWPLGEEG